MNISIDYHGCYLEHKLFFDEMANAMQKAGHKVGIITGLREKEIGYDRRVKENKIEMLNNLGFTPDFVKMWGENETISNGNLWKAYRLDDEEIDMHFDDDATEMKKYTPRWIMKTMNHGEQKKF